MDYDLRRLAVLMAREGVCDAQAAMEMEFGEALDWNLLVAAEMRDQAEARQRR